MTVMANPNAKTTIKKSFKIGESMYTGGFQEKKLHGTGTLVEEDGSIFEG